MQYYLTGDTHGRFWRIAEFCINNHTTTDDVMIILGDVGINFHLNENDDYKKEQLSNLPITLFCIQGNHEQPAYEIPTYRDKIWNGGTVYYEEEYPSILFGKDGDIFDFNGQKCIVIGGAYSIDKDYRRLFHLPWFPHEQLSSSQKQYVENQLEAHHWEIDVVLSHTVPQKYEPVDAFIPNINQIYVDKSTEEWLDTIEEHLNYKKWYAGHYHIERTIHKLQIMYENFTQLNM